MVRRTKVKDERDSKRKKKDFKSDFDSGYGSRNNSMDGEGTGNSDQSQVSNEGLSSIKQLLVYSTQ